MSTSLFKNLGLEDIDVEPENTNLVITNGEDSVEADLLNAEQQQSVIDTDQSQLGNLVEDAGDLEQVAIAMEAALVTGGISREAARFAKIAVGRIERRWHLDKVITPSMEDYDKTSRTATQVSMESLGETISKMWQALLEKLKRMWSSFRTWLIQVFDACPKLKERALQLKRRSVDVKFPTGAVLPSKYSLSYDLTMNGKIMTGVEATQALKMLQAYVKHCFDARQGEMSKTLIDDLVLAIKHAATGEIVTDKPEDIHWTVFDNSLNGFRSFLTEYATNLSGGQLEDDPTRLSLIASSQKTPNASLDFTFGAKRSKRMFGDKAIVYHTSIPKEWKMLFGMGSGGTTIATVASLWVIAVDDYDYNPAGNLKLRQGFSKLVAAGQLAAEALPGRTIAGLCDMSIGICDEISKYKYGWEARERIQRAASDNIAKTLKASQDVLTGKRGAFARSAASALVKIWQRLVSFDNDMIAYGIRTVRAVLTWCAHSLAYYAESLDAPKNGDPDYRSSSKDVARV